jgi:hypothetical protein
MFPRTRGAALAVLLALPDKKGDAVEFLDYVITPRAKNFLTRFLSWRR